MKVNMHEAKSNLSALAEKVWEGETVVIAKAGKPYVDLLPHKEGPAQARSI
jgi:antitoxin (DNA-binding transcriptional repressor) of toxin-antitoxin stability system